MKSRKGNVALIALIILYCWRINSIEKKNNKKRKKRQKKEELKIIRRCHIFGENEMKSITKENELRIGNALNRVIVKTFVLKK